MNRVIKKYPNRRLYDTAESRYITLADIKELVTNEVAFTVVDKKSGDDITRAVLLQVISEQEQHGEPIMSISFLAQVIRAHGSAAPGYLARHLENNLASWLSQQNQQLGQIKRAVGGD